MQLGVVSKSQSEVHSFPPYSVGIEVTFLVEDDLGDIELINGPIRHVDRYKIVVDNINVDGSTTQHIVPLKFIVERFL